MNDRQQELHDRQVLAIHQAVCKHIPTAAIAGGFVSPVADLYNAEIDRLSEVFPHDSQARELGLTKLRNFLADCGEPVTEGMAKALQDAWSREGMQRANWKGQFPDHLPLSQRTAWLRERM